jgi:hypothetical protein
MTEDPSQKIPPEEIEMLILALHIYVMTIHLTSDPRIK